MVWKVLAKRQKLLGYETFTIDNDPKFKPDLCIDIMKLEAKDIIDKFGHPDIIWASPPCTTFSVASIPRYWINGYPKNYKTFIGLALVSKTIELIEELKPKYYFIENPRGMLRKQKLMEKFPIRNSVTYCRYGLSIMKPTDIWTNCDIWKPREACKPGNPDHEKASRGARNGLQGVYNKYYGVNRSTEKRAIVPKELCLEILNSIRIIG